MNFASFERAKQYALECLARGLTPELTYHNLHHTRDEVVPAAVRLGALTGISRAELQLLEIGAVFHDIGFIERHQEHERAGADLAAKILPDFGFQPQQILAVQGMIMATKLPQTPKTTLEELLADADLEVLGRDDFFARGEDLRQELAAFGTAYTDRGWYTAQLEFLQEHAYFSLAARALREEGKQRNILEIKRLLAEVR